MGNPIQLISQNAEMWRAKFHKFVTFVVTHEIQLWVVLAVCTERVFPNCRAKECEGIFDFYSKVDKVVKEGVNLGNSFCSFYENFSNLPRRLVNFNYLS